MSGESLLREGQRALESGEFVKALAVFTELTAIAPRALLAWCGRAAAFYGVGEFAKSLAAAKRAIDLAPTDVRCFYVLGPAAFAADDQPGISACKSFIGKIDKNAGLAMASFWAQRLAEKDYFPQAAIAYESFAVFHLGDFDIAFQHVEVLLNAFRIDSAEEILRRLERDGAPAAGVAALHARIHLTRGDIQLAAECAKRATLADPDCIVAYAVLAETEPDAIDAKADVRLDALISNQSLPADKRIVAGMALGRAREKRGEFDAAFAAFSKAKMLAAESLAAAGHRYDSIAEEAAMRAQMSWRPLNPMRHDDGANPRHLFIIGMPRSGSTLVDQILSKHSAVHSVGESLIVPQFARAAAHAEQAGRAYREWVADRRAAFHDAYRKAGGEPKLTVDKNLFNYRHCGLIADLDAGARFILVQREPMDIGLSVFRSNFMASHAWSNDLRDIAHAIVCFETLTDLWRHVLGDRLFVLRYEDLIADFEPGVRTLLRYCDLEFEPMCLDFHLGDRAVFTQSAAQVRRPLNAHSVGRWQNFERHLENFRQYLDAHRTRLAGGPHGP